MWSCGENKGAKAFDQKSADDGPRHISCLKGTQSAKDVSIGGTGVVGRGSATGTTSTLLVSFLQRPLLTHTHTQRGLSGQGRRKREKKESGRERDKHQATRHLNAVDDKMSGLCVHVYVCACNAFSALFFLVLFFFLFVFFWSFSVFRLAIFVFFFVFAPFYLLCVSVCIVVSLAQLRVGVVVMHFLFI